MFSSTDLQGLLQKTVQDMGPTWSHKIFIVGGFVRDHLLQQKSTDLDLLVIGPDHCELFVQELYQRLRLSISRPIFAGKHHPVWHLRFHSSSFKGISIDIAHAETLEADMNRRDFTINMLAIDLTDGGVLNPCGQGLEDLRLRRLAPHPQKTLTQVFEDDPIRIFRLARFHFKYGMQLPSHVVPPDLARSPKERIKTELEKIISLGQLSNALSLYHQWGILQNLIPEIENKIEHTEQVIKNSPGEIKNQLAALLHLLSPELAANILHQFTFSHQLAAQVQMIIQGFQEIKDGPHWDIPKMRHFIRSTGHEFEAILGLAKANLLAQHGHHHLLDFWEQKNVEARSIVISTKSILNGEEIMKILRLNSGPLVAQAIQLLFQIEDQHAAVGAKLSKEEAKNELLSQWADVFDSRLRK